MPTTWSSQNVFAGPCGLCGEKNPFGNLRRISSQDVTEPGEIIVCFHRGRQILRDRDALKKLRCSRVCWGMRDSAQFELPRFEGSTPCCCEQLNKGFYVLTDPVENWGKAEFVPGH
jgi:hypothetical protein